jgi:histidyl-tRNA synthetase
LGRKKEIFHLIDRVDKISRDEWKKAGFDLGLTEVQVEFLLALINDQELWKQSPELVRIFTALEQLGVSDYVSFDPRIIRGLDYYTGTVFEAWDVGGDGRAVLGGGHYDNLVADVGGSPLAGVGFAMGDVMISLLLQKYSLTPDYTPFDNAILVTLFDEDRTLAALSFSARLREQGLKVLVYPEPAKLQKQLKYADRLGVRIVAVIGPDEVEAGNVSLKDLVEHTQVVVPQEMAGLVIRGLLAPQ